MNERWNLDVIYKGFDDPSFACDLQELKNAIAAFIALAENLEEKTPLEGLKEGTALQEKISDLGMKLYEYAMLRQSADALMQKQVLSPAALWLPCLKPQAQKRLSRIGSVSFPIFLRW